MLGVNPVSFSSPDAIFYGPRIPPELRRSLGELPWLDEPTRQLQREVQQSFDAALAEAGAPPLTAPFTDVMVTAPDAFLQLSCAGFEYERPELEGLIRYVGPLLPPRIELTPPPWWERLDERPLVIVSQGTLANVDLGQLLLPALQGLAGDELQLLLTTGGRDPALLGPSIPANAIVTEHVPFELALPRAAVLVTNGGYGSVQAALAHGWWWRAPGRTRRRWPPGWRGAAPASICTATSRRRTRWRWRCASWCTSRAIGPGPGCWPTRWLRSMLAPPSPGR